MRCKRGVKLFGLRPELLFALTVAQEVYREIGASLVITSVNDGKHSRGSLHYIAAAADLRTRHMTQAQAEKARDEIAARLTSEFDVVLETNHLHIEFQPKE